MSTLDPRIEAVLRSAAGRLRWSRFSRSCAWLALGTSLAVLIAIVALAAGWRPGRGMVLTTIVFGFLLLGVAVIVLAVAALITRRPAPWLAEAVEDANASLLDRLHTVVALDRGELRAEPEIAGRIEQQTRGELLWYEPPFAAQRRSTRQVWLAALLGILLGILVAQFTHPWASLAGPRSAGDFRAPETAQPLEFEIPLEDTSELSRAARAWGEVRIVEPGRDLRVTKVDVVPLEIEVAASAPIEAAHWTLVPTDGEPRRQGLPEPGEPTYAVYSPVIYVDELRLSDWDVVSYHAAADAGRGGAPTTYRSEIYFLEVRPFREDIEKLSGGGQGMGAQGLNELSALIDRQKVILRQTYRFVAHHGEEVSQAAGPEDERSRREDQEKLVVAERELGEAVDHAYARFAGEMENLPIAEVLDNLAVAEEHIARAVTELERRVADARGPEQAALAALVATRKSLQRSISENPEAFDGAEEKDEEPFPIAELGERLRQISEYRDEEGRERERLETAYWIEKLLEAQREQLREMEERPEDSGQEEAEQRATEIGQLLDALEEVAEEGLGGPEGETLHEALEGALGELLDQALEQLAEAESAEERGSAAGRTGRGLDEVGEAFEQSLPEGVRENRERDHLGTGNDEAMLAEALRQLQSLLEQARRGTGGQMEGPGSPGEGGESPRSELEGEALGTLRRGLEQTLGETPEARGRIEDLMEEAEEALGRGEEPVDPEALRRLLAAIEREREERAAAALDLPEPEALAHIDLSRLPAEYRRRIEEYYRRLSER